MKKKKKIKLSALLLVSWGFRALRGSGEEPLSIKAFMSF